MRTYKLYCVLLCLLFFSSPNNIVGQADPYIRKIKFKGNHDFPNRELARNISFSSSTWVGQKILRKQPSFYNQDAWEMNVRELEHFYKSEGFMHIKIGEPELKEYRRGRRIKVTFRVMEGEPVIIDSVSFTTSQEEVVEQLNRHMLHPRSLFVARPGERFRDELVWSDKDIITRRVVENGYPYADVENVIQADTTLNRANIEWQIDTGPLGYFGAVSVSGNRRTPQRIIRRQLTFQQGDVYSREKLNRSQQQIYQLGTFRIASVRAQLSRDRSDTIPVDIVITEAPRTSTRLGVGYGREDKFRTFIDFQVLNFTGGARRLNLYAKHSALEPYRIEAILTQPAAFSPNSTVTFSPSIKKQKEPGFELLSYAVNTSLLQRISDKVSSSVIVFSETVKLDTTSIAQTADVRIINQNYTKSGVGGGILFDNSRPRFNPRTGWTLALNTKANTKLFNGRYPFLKYQFEAKNYQQLFDNVILATKFKAGSIHPFSGNRVIPVEERFFAGGSRSVRGWARQQLGPLDTEGTPSGGNSLLEISVEQRIKIFGPFSMVAFFDAGNVWPDYTDFEMSEIRYAAGFGFRFTTPIGPAGIDLARPVWDIDSKWQFHLNIGHAF